MQAQLSLAPESTTNTPSTRTSRSRKPTYQKDKACAWEQICVISASSFHMLSKRKSENEIFVATLHEIDALIDQRAKEGARAIVISNLTADLMQRRRSAAQFAVAMQELDTEPMIPPEYAEYSHVFSKAESDILPPHRSYDHKIELEGEGEKALKYSPLYKMSAEELEAIKQYITENLDKGFIEPSQAPFAAPILFVKKPNGSLRLCIDFRVLNTLTRKDRYPLPLINKTLARISNTRVFIKLNIR
jgi:hypothetical protein